MRQDIIDRNRVAIGRMASGPAVFSAALLGAGGLVAVLLVEPGPLSQQMLQHLALMNVAAPLLAALLPGSGGARTGGALAAGLLQMLALWAWHAPALQSFAASSAVIHLMLLVVLFCSAIWFWRAVIVDGADHGWKAIAVLLLTGKFACLLGALLIFAPRDLYELPGLAFAFCATGASTLADQQLAGLLMVTACPLSYLVAGVGIVARMLSRLDDKSPSDVAVRAR